MGATGLAGTKAQNVLGPATNPVKYGSRDAEERFVSQQMKRPTLLYK
jgi:hypothetical protein